MKVLHYRYATLPYRNTLGYVDSYELPKVATGESNVFLYGRGARERSEFYWLKASYFTLKFHPRHLTTLVTRHDSSPFNKMRNH